MRSTEVPQDDNRMHPGERKLAYALDDQGRYVRVATTGWQVEEFVTGLALDDFDEAARDAWERARAGRASPLEVHMYAQRMDVQLLAQTTGRFQFTVRRHLRPAVFARLKPALLASYAAVLGLSVEALTTLPDAPPTQAGSPAGAAHEGQPSAADEPRA